MASRPKQPNYARNKNILVIGGSGSGKTRFFCKPSLLQAHSSYVCTDPKGTLLPEIGTFPGTEEIPYQVPQPDKLPKIRLKYNPLAYIGSEGYLKAGERPDYEHEGRRRKIFGRFVG